MTGVFGAFLSNSDDDFEQFLDAVRSVMADKPRAAARRPCVPWTTAALMCLVVASLVALLAFYYLKLV